jgi:hypothetical protein
MKQKELSEQLSVSEWIFVVGLSGLGFSLVIFAHLTIYIG